MAIQRRSSHPAAPLFALARPVFAWQAADRTGARDGNRTWTLGSAPVEASSPYGKALSFTGNTTTALTRAGVSTAAQTRFWFAAVFRWRLNAMGGGSFPQLLGTSNSNSGWRVGGTYTSGSTISLGLVKGGVASLSTVAAVDNTWYQAVGANRQDTGEHYLILKPLDVPADWLRTATADSSTSVAGDGSAGIGIARTDFAGAWSGDIAYCAAGFDWLPETAARQWLTAPRAAVTRRRIWVPVSASGSTGTLAKTNANDTASASGTTTIVGTAARTNANDASSAAGTTTVVGTVARTNANDTSAASGSVGASGVSGSLATTNANDTSSAAGTTTVVGTSARTNANDASNASGTTTVTGTVARTNANDAAAASGAAGTVTGAAAVTNANDVSSASGSGGLATVQGGGRLKKRDKPVVVEIDGQDFIVNSEEEAVVLLDRAKEEAEQVAKVQIERAAKAEKRRPGKVVADARKTLVVPQIKAPGLEAYASQILSDIRDSYASAMRTIEVAALLRKRDQAEEDDEEVLMLML